MEKLYSNIGKKIMTLAKYLLVIGWVGSLILGIVAWDGWWLDLGIGDFLIFGVGSAIIVYISNLFLYAFGQLVDDVHKSKAE